MAAKTFELKEILHEHGYSVTAQRLLIFELLNDQEPMAMHELYKRARSQLDRASIYRIVALFEHLGIVRRINIGWKYKVELGDKFAEHHHHLTCLKCHKVVPINEHELEAFITNVALSHRFKPVEHQVEIQGYCESCATGRQRSVPATT